MKAIMIAKAKKEIIKTTKRRVWEFSFRGMFQGRLIDSVKIDVPQNSRLKEGEFYSLEIEDVFIKDGVMKAIANNSPRTASF